MMSSWFHAIHKAISEAECSEKSDKSFTYIYFLTIFEVFIKCDPISQFTFYTFQSQTTLIIVVSARLIINFSFSKVTN